MCDVMWDRVEGEMQAGMGKLVARSSAAGSWGSLAPWAIGGLGTHQSGFGRDKQTATQSRTQSVHSSPGSGRAFHLKPVSS